MTARRRFLSVGVAALPMGLLLASAGLPVAFLVSRVPATAWVFDTSSLGGTVVFATAGALVATLLGGAAGVAVGTLTFPGASWLVGAACVLVAAPPAFWWIGATRVAALPWASLSGAAGGALVAGLALTPVPMLLVFAALRELPSNLYEAARVALAPRRRLLFVLLPLLKAPLSGGFLLTVVLLLGESEIPFLFGFRTAMTDVVTAFAQSYDVARTIPLAAPLLLVLLVLGATAGRPLLRTALTTSRGSHGVLRRPASPVLGLPAWMPVGLLLLSLGGYAWAGLAGRGGLRMNWGTVAASIVEPVACAWATGLLAVAAAYPLRASATLRLGLWAGLLLFCIPAALHGIGWIGIRQALPGLLIPPAAAHGSRMLGLPLLAFAIAHARLPRSLEGAALLVGVSTLRRAFKLILPLLAPSLVAASALVAALSFADRDVASLLLEPGSSRLMLDLYLLSANAPGGTMAAAALVAMAGATASMFLAAAGPLVFWRRRG